MSNHKRPKVLGEPLFPSYIFVKATNEEMTTISNMRHVINPVYWKCDPIVIPDEYINAIRQFNLKYNNISVQKFSIYPHSGQKIIRLITDNIEELKLPAIGYQLTAPLPNLEEVDVRFLMKREKSTIGEGLTTN